MQKLDVDLQPLENSTGGTPPRVLSYWFGGALDKKRPDFGLPDAYFCCVPVPVDRPAEMAVYHVPGSG